MQHVRFFSFIADNIIGCQLDGQSVTLEPGGQFELSGGTLSTLHQTCSEVNSHLYQVRRLLGSSPILQGVVQGSIGHARRFAQTKANSQLASARHGGAMMGTAAGGTVCLASAAFVQKSKGPPRPAVNQSVVPAWKHGTQILKMKNFVELTCN